MTSTSPPAWEGNSSFHSEFPLQLVWDSTSVSAFMACPYKYMLSIVEGWQPRRRSPHLVFGIALHSAFERYHKLRALDASHDEALAVVVSQSYFRQLLEEHPDRIPEGEPTKTTHTLLRTIVWYLDQFRDDPAKTHVLLNGKPAVELSFTFPLPGGFSYCGHFDRIVEFSDRLWITDYKTTKSALDARYFAQFKPSIQFAGYTIAGQVVFDAPVKGVIVDAVHLAVTSSDFARQTIHFSPGELDEFLEDLQTVLAFAKQCAEDRSWPMNPTACHHYGGCPFRKVCSHPPHVRENFLRSDFERQVWDPAKER